MLLLLRCWFYLLLISCLGGIILASASAISLPNLLPDLLPVVSGPTIECEKKKEEKDEKRVEVQVEAQVAVNWVSDEPTREEYFAMSKATDFLRDKIVGDANVKKMANFLIRPSIAVGCTSYVQIGSFCGLKFTIHVSPHPDGSMTVSDGPVRGSIAYHYTGYGLMFNNRLNQAMIRGAVPTPLTLVREAIASEFGLTWAIIKKESKDPKSSCVGVLVKQIHT